MSQPAFFASRIGRITAAACLAFLASCGGSDGTSPKNALVALNIDPATASINVGESVALSAQGHDQTGNIATPKSISWKSGSPSIATVSSSGMVVGVSAGTTVITAISGTVSAAATVTVAPVVTNLVISPSTTSVAAGSTSQLSAVPRDAAGSPVTGKSITWVSGNPSIATVSSTGVVAGVAPGTTTITASADRASATALVTVTPQSTSVTIINSLVSAITVSVNGAPAATVSGSSSSTVTTTANPLTVSWSLVRPTTTSGTPIGEQVSGVFSPVSNPGSAIQYTVDATVGTQRYFTPVVSNNSQTRLLMGVNMDLLSENRCNCVVPIGSQGVHIGYYKLFSNSNVRAYRDGSSYTGGYVYWETFSSSVLTTTGELFLSTALNPSASRLVPQLGVLEFTTRHEPGSRVVDDAMGMVPRP